MMETVLQIVAVGIGATLVMDFWGLVLRRVYGVAGLDYALVGRWIGHLLRGRVASGGIKQMPPLRAERPIGWVAHYAIGIAFAAGLVAVAGERWLQTPSLLPALTVGFVTVAAPFLILQPALGLGVAASRTLDPFAARLRSLITHLVFGAGLYLAARLLAACNSLSQP